MSVFSDSDTASSLSDDSSLFSNSSIQSSESGFMNRNSKQACSWIALIVCLLVLIMISVLIYNYMGECDDEYINQDDNEIYVFEIDNNNPNGNLHKKHHKTQWNGKVVDLDSNSFKKALKSYPEFVVAFVANGCGHCTQMKPSLHSSAKKSNIPVFTSHAHRDGIMDLVQEYNVEGFPTVIKFKNGQKLKEYQGTRQTDDLVKFYNL